ncbi:MAG: DUF4097 family beta strand repeat-containing protein [Chloroflexota bacterium]
MTVENYEDNFEVGSQPQLVVKNIRGSVRVVPGEAGAIKVKAEKIIDNCNLDDLEMEVYQEGEDTVYAVVKQPERFTIFGVYRPCKVNFVIEAPPNTRLRIKTVSAAVEAKGFSGDLQIKTVSGAQVVEEISGRLDLDSVSGGVTGGRLSGAAEISTVSGQIRLTESDLPALHARTLRGKIEAQTTLVDGPYYFSTVSGAVRLVVPEDTNCEVHASGVSGRFYTDLDLRSSTNGNRKWHLVVGEGGPGVRIKTVSGRMSLLSSFDARGSRPGYHKKTRAERANLLTQLSAGELSVDEALQELT